MKPELKDPKFQTLIVIISIAFFLTSLFVNGFAINNPSNPHGWSKGWALVSLGWMGFLSGKVLYILPWLANPLYIMSVCFYFLKKRLSFYCSLLAILMALLFTFTMKIPSNENGMISDVIALESGYFLWLGSMILAAISASQLKYRKQ
jgi:hypothetical protein